MRPTSPARGTTPTRHPPARTAVRRGCEAASRNSHRPASAIRDARTSVPRARPFAALPDAETPTPHPSATSLRRTGVDAEARPHGVDAAFGFAVHLDHV